MGQRCRASPANWRDFSHKLSRRRRWILNQLRARRRGNVPGEVTSRRWRWGLGCSGPDRGGRRSLRQWAELKWREIDDKTWWRRSTWPTCWARPRRASCIGVPSDALRVRRTSAAPCAPSPSMHVTKHTVLIESHGRTPFEATKEATTEINRADRAPTARRARCGKRSSILAASAIRGTHRASCWCSRAQCSRPVRPPGPRDPRGQHDRSAGRAELTARRSGCADRLDRPLPLGTAVIARVAEPVGSPLRGPARVTSRQGAKGPGSSRWSQDTAFADAVPGGAQGEAASMGAARCPAEVVGVGCRRCRGGGTALAGPGVTGTWTFG